MKPEAIAKARSRLRNAKRAIEQIEQCETYEDFTDHWYTFLTSNKNIYTALNKGAQSFPQSRQWMGAKARERKQDPLLQYLFQARDDDEHGLSEVTKHEPGSLGIGVNKPGISRHMHIRSLQIQDGKVSADIRPLDGKPALIELKPSRPVLVRVHGGRGSVPYDPPGEHAGKPLPDQTPLTVATLAIHYMESLIDEAESLS